MKKTPYILIVISFLLVIPSFVFAADNLVLLGQEISCSGVDCDFCNLLELANVVMKFTVGFSILLAAIGFTYVGWTLVTMAGNTGKVDKAKQVATSVVIGFVFVLAAWLIVATISQALLRSGKLPWEDIECVDFEPGPDDDDDGADDGTGGDDGAVTPEDDEPTTPTEPASTERDPVAEQEVRDRLCAGGVTPSSTSGDGCSNPRPCTDTVRTGCSNYDNLRPDTVDGVIDFKQECGADCNVVLTAGAEDGHSTRGTYTHEAGYKVDIDDTPQIDDYITENYTYQGERGGAYSGPIYTDNEGNVYVRESTHWDVTYYPDGQSPYTN